MNCVYKVRVRALFEKSMLIMYIPHHTYTVNLCGMSIDED